MLVLDRRIIANIQTKHAISLVYLIVLFLQQLLMVVFGVGYCCEADAVLQCGLS